MKPHRGIKTGELGEPADTVSQNKEGATQAAPGWGSLYSHPSWIKRQHDSALEQEYVDSLADAMRWAFDDAAPGLEPTCAGMAGVNATD